MAETFSKLNCEVQRLDLGQDQIFWLATFYQWWRHVYHYLICMADNDKEPFDKKLQVK